MEIESQLANGLLAAHPEEGARVVETLPAPEGAVVLGDVGAEIAAQVARHLAPHHAAAVLQELGAASGSHLVASLPVDIAAGFLRRMEKEARKNILQALPDSRRRAVGLLLRYPEGTAGALMDPLALGLPEDLTAQDAMNRVRESPEHVRYNLYVVDRKQLLQGVLNMRELLLAKPDDTLGAIMRRDVFRLPAESSRRDVLEHPGWHEAHSLPVVDDKGVFLGAVRYRTLRLLEDELRISNPGDAASTTRALGDLFWTGFTGLLEAMGTAGDDPARRGGTGRGA